MNFRVVNGMVFFLAIDEVFIISNVDCCGMKVKIQKSK